MKYTKGEWNVLRDAFGGLYIDVHNRTQVVAQICSESPNEEDEYNAKLIAAAPELLEVLQTIENDDKSIPEWLWLRIKNVIKKATE